MNNQESIYSLNDENDQMNNNATADDESVFSIQTNATCVSAVTVTTEMIGSVASETSYVLLDLREECDFEKWHIKESINFPLTHLKRDKMIPEIFRMKNKDGKLIVIYMFDEREGTPAAKAFFEKGYENVCLLSGGIEQFHAEYPELIEGTQVPELKENEAPEKRSVKSMKSKK